MRIIPVVVLLITASALALTQVEEQGCPSKDSGRAGDMKYAKTGKGHVRLKILGRKTL